MNRVIAGTVAYLIMLGFCFMIGGLAYVLKVLLLSILVISGAILAAGPIILALIFVLLIVDGLKKRSNR